MNTCKHCKNPIVESFYFCPTCGKKIKEPPFKFSLGKSITIIVFAVLFPPLGIIPGIKYFLKDDRRAQFVGIITIAVTIIATGLLIILTARLVSNFSKTYNEIMILQGGMQNPGQTGSQTELLNQIQELQ